MKGFFNSAHMPWKSTFQRSVDLGPIEVKVKLAYIHEEGCGKTAFYLHAMPKICGQLYADNVELLNGDTPEKSSFIQCGTCGLLIKGLSVDQIQEVEVNE